MMATLPSVGTGASMPAPQTPKKTQAAKSQSVVMKKEIEVRSFPIAAEVMVGLNFGEAKRHLSIRLDRRQAAALRCLVEGWEQRNSEATRGRRANEQDWMRAILNQVADDLGI